MITRALDAKNSEQPDLVRAPKCESCPYPGNGVCLGAGLLGIPRGSLIQCSTCLPDTAWITILIRSLWGQSPENGVTALPALPQHGHQQHVSASHQPDTSGSILLSNSTPLSPDGSMRQVQFVFPWYKCDRKQITVAAKTAFTQLWDGLCR
jgi:hypothetical protein